MFVRVCLCVCACTTFLLFSKGIYTSVCFLLAWCDYVHYMLNAFVLCLISCHTHNILKHLIMCTLCVTWSCVCIPFLSMWSAVVPHQCPTSALNHDIEVWEVAMVIIKVGTLWQEQCVEASVCCEISYCHIVLTLEPLEIKKNTSEFPTAPTWFTHILQLGPRHLHQYPVLIRVNT